MYKLGANHSPSSSGSHSPSSSSSEDAAPDFYDKLVQKGHEMIDRMQQDPFLMKYFDKTF